MRGGLAFFIQLQRKAQQANDRDFKYQQIMRNLVRRYVTVEQRKAESQGVTEDDVNEIKQDISAFRCELVEILKNSGMDTNVSAGQGGGKRSSLDFIFGFHFRLLKSPWNASEYYVMRLKISH